MANANSSSLHDLRYPHWSVHSPVYCHYATANPRSWTRNPNGKNWNIRLAVQKSSPVVSCCPKVGQSFYCSAQRQHAPHQQSARDTTHCANSEHHPVTPCHSESLPRLIILHFSLTCSYWMKAKPRWRFEPSCNTSQHIFAAIGYNWFSAYTLTNCHKQASIISCAHAQARFLGRLRGPAAFLQGHYLKAASSKPKDLQARLLSLRSCLISWTQQPGTFVLCHPSVFATATSLNSWGLGPQCSARWAQSWQRLMDSRTPGWQEAVPQAKLGKAPAKGPKGQGSLNQHFHNLIHLKFL